VLPVVTVVYVYPYIKIRIDIRGRARLLLGLALNVTTEVYIDEKVIREKTTGNTPTHTPTLIRAPLNLRAPHGSSPGQPL